MLEAWQPYIISGLTGLLVGIEREKSKPGSKTMGVRTFVLLSLLGALVGDLELAWLQAVVAAFALTLIVLSYMVTARPRQADPDRGLTTEFAGAVIFVTGVLAHTQPVVSALAGPVVALVLFSKRQLHAFTNRLKASELQAAILLLLIGVVVLNLLKDQTVDPWGIFNPRKFGMIVLVLASLEFASYALTKVIGGRKGALIIGFLGGIVSSTAVTLSAAREAKSHPQSWRQPAAAAVSAKLASFAQLLFIVGFVSPALLKSLLLPVGAGLAVGLVALALLVVRTQPQTQDVHLRSPLDLRGVLRLALLLAAILASVALAQRYFGREATFAISFLTGLFELHGVSLANATMFASDQVTAETALWSIVLAAAASLVAKSVMAWMVAPRRFSVALTNIFLAMAVTVAALAWYSL